MPTTTISNLARRIDREHAVHVWVKRSLSDPWSELQPGSYIPGELQLGSGRGDNSGQDDSFSFTLVLGRVRYSSSLQYIYTKPHENLDGWWVRVAWKMFPHEIEWAKSLGAEPYMIQDGGTVWYCPFVGQIWADCQKVLGDAVDQTFTVYGGLRYLAGCAVNGSFFEGAEEMIGWNPIPNERGDVKVLNRSAQRVVPAKVPEDAVETAFVFGDELSWSLHDFAEYIIEWFGNIHPETRSKVGRVPLTLKYADALLELYVRFAVCTVKPQPADTVLSVLQRIFQADYGLDFRVLPNMATGGYEILVFSLVGSATAFGEKTLPPNENELVIDKRNSLSIGDVQKTKSNIQRYRRYQMLGNRVQVAGTFRLALTDDGEKPTLIKGWTDEAQAKYNIGVDESLAQGDTDEQKKSWVQRENAALRNSQELKDVYARFVIDPLKFDCGKLMMNPTFSPEGQLLNGSNDNYQLFDTRTSHELPEYESEFSDEQMKPQAFLTTASDWDLKANSVKKDDRLKDSVEPLKETIGVRLRCDPNHVVLKGATTAEYPKNSGVAQDECLDFKKVVVTLAWPCDYRIAFEYIDLEVSPDAGTYSVFDQDCHCWYHSPWAFMGRYDDAGFPKVVQNQMDPEGGVIVRNDIERLKSIMAGIVARHKYQARCSVPLFSLWPVAHFVGMIASKVLRLADGAYTEEPIESVITSLRFDLGERRSVLIECGYANRQGPRKAKRVKR